MDAHHRKQVSDTKTAFHQNEAQTAKAIKEAKACCTIVIQDAKATCTAVIREAEVAYAEHVPTIQQSHRENIQDIEMEAIAEEGRDCQSFLIACGGALQACPPKVHVGYSSILYNYQPGICLWLLSCPFPPSHPPQPGRPTPATPYSSASVAMPMPTLRDQMVQHYLPD